MIARLDACDRLGTPATLPYRVAPGCHRNVGVAVIVEAAGQDEQVVGEAVDVLDRLRIDLFGAGKARSSGARLRRTTVRARCSQAAAGWPPGQDEGGQRRQIGVHGVDLGLQPVDLAGGDAQRALRFAARPGACRGRRPGRTGRSGCAPAWRRPRRRYAGGPARARRWPRRPCRRRRPAGRAWRRGGRRRARSGPCRRPACRCVSSLTMVSAAAAEYIMNSSMSAANWNSTRKCISGLPCFLLNAPPLTKLPMPRNSTPRVRTTKARAAKGNQLMTTKSGRPLQRGGPRPQHGGDGPGWQRGMSRGYWVT